MSESESESVARTSVAVTPIERPAWAVSGFVGVAVSLGLVMVSGWLLWSSLDRGDGGIPTGLNPALLGLGLLSLAAATVAWASIATIAPGSTRVVQLFGRYVGTVRRTGLVWLLPLTGRRVVSVRVNNFDTPRLKVNDAAGNPVEIAAIVVWQVADTALSTFAVEDVEGFVHVQAEAAVRHVARTYPYDGGDDVESLRRSTDVISRELAEEMAERVEAAGVTIIEVRISHLAYAPEIAQAMLQRQQAAAVVAARTTIVEGAVGMVQLALAELSRAGVVDLDEERKAAMVSNLLVVLCGDSRVSPVVNTGTLYG